MSSTPDFLAADDLYAMVAPQVLDRVAELVRASNRIAAELTRTVRECQRTQARSVSDADADADAGAERGGCCAPGGRWRSCRRWRPGSPMGHYLACLDPDGPEPDPTEGRSLPIARRADGCVSLRGRLDAVRILIGPRRY